ncbi:uncharacterized protein BYT42DRAFT_490613 [Radiomyces spectabilis]|uniref:uncharacterized protein n=1 Tax=Radiomyces spectabilis TaxID=64574 RepID=UPI002220F999|nr:uncharacterized protein BYT42DRAFT_490613 [Radiomyces spectabilis]KAI8391308.1 hypothetical protein BYT42DRAFT_490613 [Radiomyces spectabilis]
MKTHTYGEKPGNQPIVETCLKGQLLLNHPLLNKGSAFSKEERDQFELASLLPYTHSSLEDQTARIEEQYKQLKSPIVKNQFLQSVQQQNEVLFYDFILRNLEEVLPIIYTPTEGEFIESYSHVFRRPRGIYLNYPEADELETVLLEGATQNGLQPDDIDLILVTDSQEILGIGDQGVGGVAISVAKLILYTTMAGIHPARVLPVVLDVGTDNENLLKDPLYLGWRHKRVQGSDYDEFVDTFAKCVQKNFKKAFLHWEDFGVTNARRLLQKYRPSMSTFNDDVQGTGAITLATLLAALKVKEEELQDQKIVIYGAGTAGIGVADQLRSYMQYKYDISAEEAAKKIWCVDKPGLLNDAIKDDEYKLSDVQQPYVRPKKEIEQWELESKDKHPQLYDVVKNAQPTVLIGVSTQGGAFNEKTVREMAEHCPSGPVIFPLSNPTRLAEATPKDLFQWTDGNVLVATGSPFDPVHYGDKEYQIAECNNSFVYPGIGLGCIVSRAKHCTDEMIMVAAEAVSNGSPACKSKKRTNSLLPGIEEARQVSMRVAIAVANKAIELGEARNNIDPDDMEKTVRDFMWDPKYPDYKLMKA